MWIMKWSGAAPVPVLLARWRVDHVAWTYFDNLATTRLHPAAAVDDVQRLAVTRCARALSAAVVEALEQSEGLSVNELLAEVNLARGRVDRCLKLLEVDGAVLHEHERYIRTADVWTPDEEHSQRQ